MAKRFLMVVLFAGAIGLASLAFSSTADARGCYRGGGGYYGGGGFYPSYYSTRSFYSPYRSFYHGGWGGHHHGFYGGHHGFHSHSGIHLHGRRGGIHIGF